MDPIAVTSATLRAQLPDVPLREGATMMARVAAVGQQSAVIVIAGVPVNAQLPPEVPQGATLRLKVTEVTQERVMLKIEPEQGEQPAGTTTAKPAPQAPAAPLPGAYARPALPQVPAAQVPAQPAPEQPAAPGAQAPATPGQPAPKAPPTPGQPAPPAPAGQPAAAPPAAAAQAATPGAPTPAEAPPGPQPTPVPAQAIHGPATAQGAHPLAHAQAAEPGAPAAPAAPADPATPRAAAHHAAEAPSEQAAAAQPATTQATPILAQNVPLAPELRAQVKVEEEPQRRQGADGLPADVVSLSFNSPTLGRLDLRLELRGERLLTEVTTPAGRPYGVAARAAERLRANLESVGLEATVKVTPRSAPLDLYA